MGDFADEAVGSEQKGEYHRKQFNIDGTYNGAYSDMIRVPQSTYMFMLNSAQQVIPSINAHAIAQNVTNARKNAHDPAAYNYYMNKAKLYKKYNVNNPDVDSRIRQSLTDPMLKNIDKKLNTFRTKSQLLKTTLGMKQYQTLINKRRTRFQVLENDERERFNKFINNPSYNLPDGEPRSMKDVPYHSSVLKSFISRHPDLIESDPSHNMYILGKKVSDDPRQASRIIHFLSHDYADIHKAPHGSVQLVDTLMKKGFRIDDFGNKYLREHLIMQRDGRRHIKKEEDSSAVVYPRHTPHPPTTPRPAHTRSRIPVSSGKKEKHDSTGDSTTPRMSRQILRHLAEYRKRQTPHESGFAPGVRPRGDKSPPPSTSRSRRQTRQQTKREEEQTIQQQKKSQRELHKQHRK